MPNRKAEFCLYRKDANPKLFEPFAGTTITVVGAMNNQFIPFYIFKFEPLLPWRTPYFILHWLLPFYPSYRPASQRFDTEDEAIAKAKEFINEYFPAIDAAKENGHGST